MYVVLHYRLCMHGKIDRQHTVPLIIMYAVTYDHNNKSIYKQGCIHNCDHFESVSAAIAHLLSMNTVLQLVRVFSTIMDP